MVKFYKNIEFLSGVGTTLEFLEEMIEGIEELIKEDFGDLDKGKIILQYNIYSVFEDAQKLKEGYNEEALRKIDLLESLIFSSARNFLLSSSFAEIEEYTTESLLGAVFACISLQDKFYMLKGNASKLLSVIVEEVGRKAISLLKQEMRIFN